MHSQHLREGNGNPLQYSCLENPMDREAWWASLWDCKESDTTEWLTHTWPTSTQTHSQGSIYSHLSAHFLYYFVFCDVTSILNFFYCICCKLIFTPPPHTHSSNIHTYTCILQTYHRTIQSVKTNDLVWFTLIFSLYYLSIWLEASCFILMTYKYKIPH